MLQFLSPYCKIRKASSINTLKFILNINFATRSFHSKFKQVDLLEINRKNMQCVTLLGKEGYKMPVIGIGTWKALEDDVYNAVLTALNVGYRHIGKSLVFRLIEFNEDLSWIKEFSFGLPHTNNFQYKTYIWSWNIFIIYKNRLYSTYRNWVYKRTFITNSRMKSDSLWKILLFKEMSLPWNKK